MPDEKNNISYTLIRSDRKTIAIQIKPDGQVIVRAPRRMAEYRIRKFVESKADWIQKQLSKIEIQSAEMGDLTKFSAEEIRELADRALHYIPERVNYYAPLIGVTYGKITIRNQKTRWGSCSSMGNLNFNCLLMLTPPEVIDSVVVHELCHLKEMNHSKRFYAEIYCVFPEYDKWSRWLKENGVALIRRL